MLDESVVVRVPRIALLGWQAFLLPVENGIPSHFPNTLVVKELAHADASWILWCIVDYSTGFPFPKFINRTARQFGLSIQYVLLYSSKDALQKVPVQKRVSMADFVCVPDLERQWPDVRHPLRSPESILKAAQLIRFFSSSDVPFDHKNYYRILDSL